MPSHHISSLQKLTALYGTPNETSLRKVASELTPAYRDLMNASPFLALATEGPDGLDVSPRGDPAPVVKELTPKTLLIPDRRGNQRLDSLRNIVTTGRAALLFLIPGCSETLRMNGNAHLSTDPKLLKTCKMQDKLPTSIIVFDIVEIYFQCARAVKRADLWNPATYPDRKTLPSAGQLTKSAFAEFDATAYDAKLQDRQAKTMY